jgi:hypothetical protein
VSRYSPECVEGVFSELRETPAPSDWGGAACSPQRSGSLPAGGPCEGVGIIDVDAAVPHLDTPALPQLRERTGDGLSVGPDHGGKLVVGVAGRDHLDDLVRNSLQGIVGYGEPLQAK